MKYKFFKIIPTIILSCIPFALSSCGYNKNNYVFVLENTANEGDYNKFAKDIQDTFNSLKTKSDKYKNLSNITITVKGGISDNQTKKDLIENGTADFAFLTAKSLLTDSFYNKVYPLIQTLTTPFTFDEDMSAIYVDGSETDPLRQIASNMQKQSFGTDYSYPLSSWKDEKKVTSDNEIEQPYYDWNGIRYNAFYDTSAEAKLTSGYRGMIVLSGTDEQIRNAKKAWTEKNWNTFRSYGIVVGKSSSAGTYLLQEQLIKKHFGLGANWSLAEDKLKNPNYYEQDSSGGTSKIGKSSKFIINFTDEGSFAWTHNTKSNSDYSPTIENAKIEILTVTNPAVYDIGVFNKHIDKNVVDLLTESIIYLYTSQNNLYGEGLGYNGYSLINDFDNDVIKTMKNALGDF